MKVAVAGCSGYIAGYIIERLHRTETVETVKTIGRNKDADDYLDLRDAAAFDYSALDGMDYVIFTAAVSGPDECAYEYKRCWNMNVTGTSCFIEQAVKRGCRILFFSSDAVYGDIPGEIYTEESETKAETPYGRMKKAVEDKFKHDPSFKTIRLSYVVSERDKFTSYCMNCMKRGKTAEIFHPFYRNCVTMSDVVDIVLWMIQNWDQYAPFVLNAAGMELVSRVRIADELNRILGGGLKYVITAPEERFYENRPKITQTKSLYLQKYQIIEDDMFSVKIKKELRTK